MNGKTIEEMMKFVKEILTNIPKDKVKEMVNMIMQADKIFVYGAGIAGLFSKTFAMKLMHLGFDAYVIGETITPSFISKNLLIAISSSGRTISTVTFSKKAKELNGQVICITSRPNSQLEKVADLAFIFENENEYPNLSKLNVEWRGFLFLLSVFIFLQFEIISKLLILTDQTIEEAIRKRHATIE